MNVDAQWKLWDDRNVDSPGPDLTTLRSTWDYPSKPGDLTAWIKKFDSKLLHPSRAVLWNMDKSCLLDLAATDVAVVPTIYACVYSPKMLNQANSESMKSTAVVPFL